MANLHLYLLGPPQIRLGEANLELKRRKALALLVYLVISQQTHSRDALATLFWPNSDQRAARTALRSALYALNKTPVAPMLEVDKETVRINSTDLWVDVLEFQALLQNINKHQHPQASACQECLRWLTEAAKLYRDDFLAGFSLADSPAFDEWQFFQSEQHRQDLTRILRRLIDIHQGQDDPDLAIPYARRWLALDPLHEPAHRMLMRLYAQTGQQGSRSSAV